MRGSTNLEAAAYTVGRRAFETVKDLGVEVNRKSRAAGDQTPVGNTSETEPRLKVKHGSETTEKEVRSQLKADKTITEVIVEQHRQNKN